MSLNKSLSQQIDKTRQWIEEDRARRLLPRLTITYGVKVTSDVGEQVFTRGFDLLDIKANQKPDFSKPMNEYVDEMVSEFRSSLLDAIEELSLGEPWSTVADANAIREDSAEAVDTQAAQEESISDPIASDV